MGVYNLYSLDGKPVCDFVLVSTTQQRTVDTTAIGLELVAGAVVLGLFFPFIAPIMAGGILALHNFAHASGMIKDMTTKEQADIMMLKVLEHYGLVRLLGNDQIQLVND